MSPRFCAHWEQRAEPLTYVKISTPNAVAIVTWPAKFFPASYPIDDRPWSIEIEGNATPQLSNVYYDYLSGVPTISVRYPLNHERSYLVVDVSVDAPFGNTSMLILNASLAVAAAFLIRAVSRKTQHFAIPVSNACAFMGVAYFALVSSAVASAMALVPSSNADLIRYLLPFVPSGSLMLLAASRVATDGNGKRPESSLSPQVQRPFCPSPAPPPASHSAICAAPDPPIPIIHRHPTLLPDSLAATTSAPGRQQGQDAS